MWKWTQRSFAGGQQDLTLAGRQDLASYFTSARTLENFLVKRQGCISKRRGTNLVAQLGNLFNQNPVIYARIIPFVYEREGGFMLLFASDGTQSKMFVLSNQGVLVTRIVDGVETEVWTEVIDEADTPVSVDIPYAGSDFNAIGYTQSGDRLWLAHSEYPFAEINRSVGGTFSYRVIDFLAMGEPSQIPTPIIKSVTPTGFGNSTSKKSVEYVVTAVKNGIESKPSTPFKVTYSLPWTQEAVIKVTIEPFADFTPDFFNIYKKNSGDFGFIGSTSNREIAIDRRTATADAPDEILKTYSGTRPSDAQIIASYPLVVNALYGNYGYGRAGYIYEDGILEISLSTPQIVDSLNISSGHIIATWNSGNYPVARAQLVPCKAVVYKVVFTFEDGKTETKYTQDFSQVYKYTNVPSKNYKGGPWGSAWANAIRAAAQELAETEYVTAYLYADGTEDSEKKRVTKVTITGYADTARTTIATGSISKSGNIVSTVGNPVILSGIVFIKRGGSMNSFEDDYITPDVSLTPPVVEPHFEDEGKYPACVSLQNQRLALAATNAQPFTLWMSVTGDLYNFNTHASIREDDAIEATVPATEFPEINHIVAAKEMLLMCDNGEWVVSPVSGNTISYKTIQIKQQSRIGCSKRLPPLAVADEIIFSESTNETLRSIRYDFTTDGYQSVDLSVLSQSLTRNNPIVDYAFKQHPDSIIVCVREDGTLATLTYMKEHELCAWSTAVLGGDMKAIGVCSDKAIRDGTTDLYILAEHPLIEEDLGNGTLLGSSAKIDGTLLLLRVREDAPAETVENSLCLDAMHIITAEAYDTIPTGRVAIDLTTGQEVTALVAGERYAVGYPYAATFRSIPPEAQGENTIQFEIKGAKSAELRLENASAFKIVPTVLEHEDDNYWTTCGDDATITDGKVAFSKQDHLVDLAGDANTSGAITIKSDSVWPMTLLSYSINFEFDPRLLGQKG